MNINKETFMVIFLCFMCMAILVVVTTFLYVNSNQKVKMICEINNNYAELINSDLIPQIEKDNNIKLSKIVSLNCDTMELELKGSSD